MGHSLLLHLCNLWGTVPGGGGGLRHEWPEGSHMGLSTRPVAAGELGDKWNAVNVGGVGEKFFLRNLDQIALKL